MTKIKICGLSRKCDIDFVNEAKPDWCGFIINFPKSRRNVDPGRLRELRKGLSPEIPAVGVFVDQAPEFIASLVLEKTIDIVQLHGHEDNGYIENLKSLLPGCEIWKAFQIHGRTDVLEARESKADVVLLDGGMGAGKTFDWSLLKAVDRPFILAGGLRPDSIQNAVKTVHPMGLDISSGVETGGVKDRNKILAAVAACREAV